MPGRENWGSPCGAGKHLGKLGFMTQSCHYSVRPLTATELPDILHLDQAAFMVADDPDDDHSFFEWDRTFGVRDQNQLIGFNASFSLKLTVPSGADGAQTSIIPMAGLSWVAVHPGYRRRGVLTTMMNHHLTSLHEQQAEPLSGLHPSEPQIYGRFGYRAATSAWRLELPRDTALRQVRAQKAEVQVRFLQATPAQAELVADLYARSCAQTPGAIDRTPALTRLELHDTPRTLARGEPLRLLLAERNGEPTGYLLLRRACTWSDATGQASTEILESAILDLPSSYRLWQAATSFDLTSGTTIRRLGAADPLFTWLEDPRTPKPTRVDKLWLRIVDLDRALTARSYGCAIDVVLEIRDQHCPWNAGRWRLIADPTGASCARTQKSADLSLDIGELAAVLPGGVTLSALAHAGLVDYTQDAVLHRTSTAFRSATEPGVSYLF